MSDRDENSERPDENADRRPFPLRRKLLAAAGFLAILAVLGTALIYGLFRAGVFDGYIKSQFIARLDEMGVDFKADAFRVFPSPLELRLENAVFSNKANGETLLIVRDARFKFTLIDMLALKLSREISIDRTEIDGAELFIKFDENGRSNFSGIHLIESEEGSRLSFRYDAVNVAVRDSVVHFGDISHRIAGEAKDLGIGLTPTGERTAAGDPRSRFNLSSSGSAFSYDDRTVENLDIRANGVIDGTGADLTEVTVRSPLGEASASGRLDDWKNLNYSGDINSTVDLTQASMLLASTTALRGVGNFKGKISGAGEQYKIEGTIDSEALRADGVYLKAVNVSATMNGTNANYEGNGRAVAEMLTFGDFKVNMLNLFGNIRGTGTDFRWVGELQAAAAETGALTFGKLFLRDALAEYKDRELRAAVGDGVAQKFSIGDLTFDALRTRDMRLLLPKGRLEISAPAASAKRLAAPEYAFDGVTGRGITVKHAGSDTEVAVNDVHSPNGSIAGAGIIDLTAGAFRLLDKKRDTQMTFSDVSAARVESDGTVISGIDAPEVTIGHTPGLTTIYSDHSRVAAIDTGSARLGEVNIGGIRLSIRNGIVQGSSNDIDAGNIALVKGKGSPGGSLDAVKFGQPVFVVEPAGRYRASADMSIGGGTVGSIALGRGSAKVTIDNDAVDLTSLTAEAMNGSIDGTIRVGLSDRTRSAVDVDFAGIDLSKLIAVQAGRIVPLDGTANGSVHLKFGGTDYRTSSGEVKGTITANTLGSGDDRVPISGRFGLSAANGLVSIADLDLSTGSSKLTGTGRFDMRGQDSDLALSLNSTDGSEVQRIFEVTGAFPELNDQLHDLQLSVAGNFAMTARLTGDIFEPNMDAKASAEQVIMRHRAVGRVTADILTDANSVTLRNGVLTQQGGGKAAFEIKAPFGIPNSVAIDAVLDGVNAGDLLGALPIDLPSRIADLNGRTTGTVKISGLPNKATGSLDLTAVNGQIAKHNFDELHAKATFENTLIRFETANIKLGQGYMAATGEYDRATTRFDLSLDAKALPFPLVLSLLPPNDSIPAITGLVDVEGTAQGEADMTSTYNINFNGVARAVTIGESPFGDVVFEGRTADQKLTANLSATLDGRLQTIAGTMHFDDAMLPFEASTVLNDNSLTPYLAFFPQLKDIPITGKATGRVELSGTLRQPNSSGQPEFSSRGLSGSAQFSQLSMTIQDTPLAAAEPVSIKFNAREVVFENAKFAGSGSNMAIAGTKALAADAVNDLSINGRISLNLVNLFTKDTFYAGLADVAVRITGQNTQSRLSGTASTENASFAAFIGTDRLTLDRIRARVIFSSDQADIENMSGYLGGGKFTAGGGAILNGLSVQSFRLSLNGSNVTVPLPQDFITTGDARIDITGIRGGSANVLQVTIGGRVYARRSLYSHDIDLANVIGARHERPISSGPSSIAPPRFDLVIEGRDALTVRNNIADLTASVSLVLTGDANEPRLSGRITANSGTMFYRNDRYDIQRGVLEFPPDTTIEPVIDLQAESEINGYQIFVNLSGPLKDTERLTANVRSVPALPSDDVVSLITTGSLANTAGGIPTLAQSGINTAAEIITDSIINAPARRATNKLFGLNVFEIDPIISGQQAGVGASARLTVGRQINNNLRVTYATNLSQDQNQVLALEYRVSNKLSFVAQYEQRSLTNVTRNRDNFSFEVRFRRRF